MDTFLGDMLPCLIWIIGACGISVLIVHVEGFNLVNNLKKHHLIWIFLLANYWPPGNAAQKYNNIYICMYEKEFVYVVPVQRQSAY